LEENDDGIVVIGMTFDAKAYGIGTCIVVFKGIDGLFHHIVLKDILYMPNISHRHPRIFSDISACS